MGECFHSKHDWIKMAFVAFFFALVIMVGVINVSYQTASADVYWHLAMGRDMVENQIFPRFDRYSFTWQGEELVTFPFIFEIIIYSLVKTFGYDAGAKIYLLTGFASVLLLAIYYLKKIRAGILLSCMTIVALALFMNFRLLIRPEILSNILIIIALILYKNAEKYFSLKALIPIFGLMIFWVNYHSPIFGYIVFLGLYIDIAIRYFSTGTCVEKWSLWLLSGVLLCLAGYLNPFLYNEALSLFSYDDDWYKYIAEYENIFHIFSGYLGAVPILVMALLSISMAIRLKRYGYLAILVICVAGTISYSRIVTSSGIVITLLFADMLADEYASKDFGAVSFVLQRYSPAAFLVVLSPLYFVWLFAYSGDSQKMPYNLKNYFIDRGYSGKILNHYTVGGFLIYYLHPRSHVFIDGRAGILYKAPFYKEYEASFQNPEVLSNNVSRYGVDYVVAQNQLSSNEVIYRTKVFQLDFVDENYSLYVRGGGNFPVSGLTMSNPACWEDGYIGSIKDELARAKEIPGLNSRFVDYLKMLVEFGAQKGKENQLEKAVLGAGNDHVKRFLAYQALRYGQYELAERLFFSLSNAVARDILALAHILYKQGRFQASGEVLNVIFGMSPAYVSDNDRLIIHVLASNLKEKTGFKMVDRLLLKNIESYFLGMGISPSAYEISYKSFCGIIR